MMVHKALCILDLSVQKYSSAVWIKQSLFYIGCCTASHPSMNQKGDWKH